MTSTFSCNRKLLPLSGKSHRFCGYERLTLPFFLSLFLLTVASPPIKCQCGALYHIFPIPPTHTDTPSIQHAFTLHLAVSVSDIKNIILILILQSTNVSITPNPLLRIISQPYEYDHCFHYASNNLSSSTIFFSLRNQKTIMIR